MERTRTHAHEKVSSALSSKVTTLQKSRAAADTHDDDDVDDVTGERVPAGQTVCLAGAGRACYKMAHFHHVSSRVDFREAELACHTDGGELVSIGTLQEQRHIERLLEELRSGSGISDGDFWIGLTRVDEEDENPPDGVASCPRRYKWSDGSAASFRSHFARAGAGGDDDDAEVAFVRRNWYSDEPSCGAESCVAMYHQPGALPGVGGAYLYRWNDDRCSMKHNFICEYQPERHPEKELGATAGGRGSVSSPDEGRQVTSGGSSGTLLLLYASVCAISVLPLILLVAFHALGRSPATRRASFWISKTAKGGVVEQ
ncbi:chondrolectin-like isoform X2 [Syngnathoides biaculeatus]|uniref:chondrolectin-like isoform X2 n=1 Tax=Syngnathoides biaculeatus TaxID=300417 RepID=UPI002ADE4B88|nr:chondrolectin-like isoform X2 [Syngnathoides biaculeatus]